MRRLKLNVIAKMTLNGGINRRTFQHYCLLQDFYISTCHVSSLKLIAINGHFNNDI